MASRRTHHRLIGLVVALATMLPASGWAVVPTAAQSSVPCVPESEPNDRAEEAPETLGEVCFTGTLVEKPDQDLWFWTVQAGGRAVHLDLHHAGCPGRDHQRPCHPHHLATRGLPDHDGG